MNEQVRTQGNGNVKYDLRYRHGTKAHFGLEDIRFSTEYNSDPSKFNVTKMIAIEKQPRYPVYYDNAVDVGGSFLGGLVSELATAVLGKTGSAALTKAAIPVGGYAGIYAANRAVEGISTEAGATKLYREDKYLDNIKNLFTTLTTDHIISYEMPFLSDYFISVDGDEGWKTMGIDSHLGDVAKTLSKMHLPIGYPITPNWEYGGSSPSFKNQFHLINDTTSALNSNLNFLMSLVPGMMHVLISGGTLGMETGADIGKNVAGNFTSLYKSPNVYEIIVPGRLRWLWCTMSVDVTFVGKVYSDIVQLNNSRIRAFTGDSDIIGFPEAYKLEITVKSLLPKSFNEYYYFLSKPGAERGSLTHTETKMERAFNKKLNPDVVTTSDDEMLGAGESSANKLLDSIKNSYWPGPIF